MGTRCNVKTPFDKLRANVILAEFCHFFLFMVSLSNHKTLLILYIAWDVWVDATLGNSLKNAVSQDAA